MTNIRTTIDMGDVFWDASAAECYHKLADQPSLGAATVSPGVGDVTSIAGQSFNYETSAPHHAPWTACQVCAATNVAAYHSDETSGDTAFRTVLTAPADGYARIWHDVNLSDVGIYVNNVHVLDMPAGFHRNFQNARGLVLNSGDVVQVGASGGGGGAHGTSDTMHVRFIPRVYP